MICPIHGRNVLLCPCTVIRFRRDGVSAQITKGIDTDWFTVLQLKKMEGSDMATKMVHKFGDGYKFVQGGVTVAGIDRDGKLWLKGEGGSLETWETWQEYVKKELSDTPTTGDVEAILAQLSPVLGEAQALDLTPTDAAPKPKVKAEATPQKGESDMATKAKVPAKKAAVKSKANGAAAVNECSCGCGGKTAKNFCPGHDSRVHSWAKKLAAGEIKQSAIPAIALKYIKSAHA